jgi:hypothetical protein
MSNLLAVLIGALIGLGGVVAGTWLQGRKEHQRWLRDQKLHAAIDIQVACDAWDRDPPGEAALAGGLHDHGGFPVSLHRASAVIMMSRLHDP